MIYNSHHELKMKLCCSNWLRCWLNLWWNYQNMAKYRNTYFLSLWHCCSNRNSILKMLALK